MAKVLIVDFYSKGHHKEYIENILKINKDNEVISIYPEQISNVYKSYVLNGDLLGLDVKSYLKFLKFLDIVISNENPDIVHVLTGDMLYKYFGLGLKKALSKCKAIVTFHHLRYGMLHNISLKYICKNFDKCVVHSDNLKAQLDELKINNGTVIQYPHFHKCSNKTTQEIRDDLGIPQDAFVFGAFGGTRYDKGLDILLEAMELLRTDNNAFVLVAGKPVDFSENFINDKIKNYRSKTKLIIKSIEDDLYEDCLKCVDAVVVPYRKSFNGASGPLNEGTIYKKIIIGPNEGNLGYTIKKHHLGYVFESENPYELAEAMRRTMNDEINIDNEYINYLNELNPNRFYEKYRTLYEKLLKNQ